MASRWCTCPHLDHSSNSPIYSSLSMKLLMKRQTTSPKVPRTAALFRSLTLKSNFSTTTMRWMEGKSSLIYIQMTRSLKVRTKAKVLLKKRRRSSRADSNPLINFMDKSACSIRSQRKIIMAVVNSQTNPMKGRTLRRILRSSDSR